MNRTPYISLTEMDGITERILTEFGFDPLAKRVCPVPVEEIVEFHYDLQICWEPIDRLDADGMVMAAIIPDRKQIILNETHRALFDSKIGTYHFTLAHELGHWVLHAEGQTYLRNGDAQPEWAAAGAKAETEAGTQAGAEVEVGAVVPQPYFCRSSSRKPIEEVQADLFAGCLLMPRPMMERALKQLNMIGTIRLHHLYGLADCLKVSISALSVRLKQLGLLDVDREGRVNRTDRPAAPHYEQLTMDM